MPIILLFFFIYGIQFKWFPLRTDAIMAILGLFLLLADFKNRLKKNFVLTVAWLSTIASFALISIFLNGTNDFYFVKYFFTRVAYLCGAYFVVRFATNFFSNLNFQKLSLWISDVIFIQTIIAVLMFAFPSFAQVILDLQTLLPSAERVTESVLSNNSRLLGLGPMFFGAGIINGFALILICSLIRFFKLSRWKIFLLSLKFLWILVVGMMMARTTAIGALLGVALILFPNLGRTCGLAQKRLFFFIPIILFLPLSLSAPFFLNKLGHEEAASLFNFAFEAAVNYLNNDTFETASTNELKNMYIFPSGLSTWVKGDGLWADPTDENAYYMHTDVGYLRLIYYFGVPGLILFLSFQFFIIKHSFKNRLLTILIFIYVLILNLKGFADIVNLSSIFFWLSHSEREHPLRGAA